MTVASSRRLIQAMTAVVVFLLVLHCKLYWDYGRLKIQVAFASEQIAIFDAMRSAALQSDLAGAAGKLQYVVWYYPSGSKQQTGSRLDQIVERERTNAVKQILTYLKTKTGEDLGNDPQKWIEKYAKDK